MDSGTRRQFPLLCVLPCLFISLLDRELFLKLAWTWFQVESSGIHTEWPDSVWITAHSSKHTPFLVRQLPLNQATAYFTQFCLLLSFCHVSFFINFSLRNGHAVQVNYRFQETALYLNIKPGYSQIWWEQPHSPTQLLQTKKWQENPSCSVESAGSYLQ